MKNGGRFTLSVRREYPLDGIDNVMEVDLFLRHAMSLGVPGGMVLMNRGYLDVGVIWKVEALNLEYIIPAKDNPRVLRFRKMKHCDSGFSFIVIGDIVLSGNEYIETKFVHVIYYSGGKRHDFSFNTNAEVIEGNAWELSETYRERWGYRERIPRKVEHEGEDTFSRNGCQVFPLLSFSTAVQHVDATEPPAKNSRE